MCIRDSHDAVHGGIAVDEISHAVYIMNNCLCTAVSRRGFGAEDKGGRRKVLDAAVLDGQIQIHDTQRVQQLALILVQALDLHIKDLNNALDCAHTVGSPLPMTAAVQEIFQWLHNNGCGQDDHSSIIKYYKKLTGIESL